MDPAQQQKVLSTIYDRLMEAITYSPGGKPTGTTGDRPLLQMAKNFVINPKDMSNALSPMNPGKTASLATAEAFSAMADALPQDASPLWTDSGRKLSEVYRTIVNGANTDNTVDPKQKKTYDKAYTYLNQALTIESFDGSDTGHVGSTPSPIALAYEKNQTAYVSAVLAYQTAYDSFDMSTTADQRRWNTEAPTLQNAIDQAWNKWTREGKVQVDQAKAALVTTINDAIAAAIEQARGLVRDAQRPSVLERANWLLSYAQPGDWTDPSCNFSQLTLKSSSLNETASASATSYSVGASGASGLWSVGGSYGHSDAESNAHMDASEFELSAELVLVRIMRPWYNPLLFSMKDWWVKGFDKDSISKSDGVLPHVPTSLVFARNVTIEADFGDADRSHMESGMQAGARVGWGPFSVSGSYAHSESADAFTSSHSGGAVHLPGLQLIGVVCATTPSPCPPMDTPAAS